MIYKGKTLLKWVRNRFGNSFIFFGIFFFGLEMVLGLSRLLFGEPRGEMQVSCGFSGHLGVLLGLSSLRSGETSGEMQVSCGFDRKNCRKKHFSRSFLFSVCVCTYVFLCVYVCNRVCSISLFFLLLFCFLIQCTSFLVFAIIMYYI